MTVKNRMSNTTDHLIRIQRFPTPEIYPLSLHDALPISTLDRFDSFRDGQWCAKHVTLIGAPPVSETVGKEPSGVRAMRGGCAMSYANRFTKGWIGERSDSKERPTRTR